MGGAARITLLAPGPAKVFAAFERSFYIETSSGIACVGGPGIGKGPLNIIVESDFRIPEGTLQIDTRGAKVWEPASLDGKPRALPQFAIPEFLREVIPAFQKWLDDGEARSPDELIGLGPGLTPAGDDFAGGAMIALRAAGKARLADRVAAWALPLAEHRTSRISRAHLRCAAMGEGHEALHGLLAALNEGDAAIARAMQALDRVGHSSGRDAAAGALFALS